MENDLLINALYRIIELQEKILMQLENGVTIGDPIPPPIDTDKKMNRQQAIDYLNISEATYKRKVKDGTLKPMQGLGGDRFYKRDLDAAYKESIRRGRI